jgi:hypothetical protein
LQDPRIGWIHAIPNGGDRDKITAGVMVATGTRSGVWDICMPFPVAPFPFGYIEMKRPIHRNRKNQNLSDSQVNFGKHLISVGAFYAVCFTADEAIIAIRKFLKGEAYYVSQ